MVYELGAYMYRRVLVMVDYLNLIVIFFSCNSINNFDAVLKGTLVSLRTFFCQPHTLAITFLAFHLIPK